MPPNRRTQWHRIAAVHPACWNQGGSKAENALSAAPMLPARHCNSPGPAPSSCEGTNRAGLVKSRSDVDYSCCGTEPDTYRSTVPATAAVPSALNPLPQGAEQGGFVASPKELRTDSSSDMQRLHTRGVEDFGPLPAGTRIGTSVFIAQSTAMNARPPLSRASCFPCSPASTSIP